MLIWSSGNTDLLLFPHFVVKTRKEAKRMAIMESVSVMKARVEELKGLVKDQRGRKDEYATIIAQQSEGTFHNIPTAIVYFKKY